MMRRREEIYCFAIKWLEIFDGKTETDDCSVVDAMGNECESLGFIMDCGKSFEAVHGEAVYNYMKLEEVINEINDAELLGSGIYSRWRYYNHWADVPYFAPQSVKWFVPALKRLAELTSEEYRVLKDIKKIQIDTNVVCFGPRPDDEEEVSQHLTINSMGRVWLTGRNVDDKVLRKESFSIGKDKAAVIISAFEDFYEDDIYDYGMHIYCTDIGFYHILFTDENGNQYMADGSLMCHRDDDTIDISGFTRHIMERKDLFVVDGDAVFDSVNRITLEYRNLVKTAPGELPEGADSEYFTLDYSEKIVIDREASTLNFSKVIGEGCRVNTEYYVEGGIENLLDSFDEKYLFRDTEGNPDNAVFDPMDEKTYTFIVETEKGKTKTLTGSFDKLGLPDDYEEFIETVQSFMSFYEGSALFNENEYGRCRRCTDDYIYLSVSFGDSDKTYYYVTEDDSISEGDLVVVPAGCDDHHAVVIVRDVEYFKKDDVPLPYEKTKKVIRKCTPEECEEIWGE